MNTEQELYFDLYRIILLYVVLLQTFVEAEKVENKAKQEQLKGNSIRYDECVQLRHTLTGKCICVAREISVTEDSKLKVCSYDNCIIIVIEGTEVLTLSAHNYDYSISQAIAVLAAVFLCLNLCTHPLYSHCTALGL